MTWLYYILGIPMNYEETLIQILPFYLHGEQIVISDFTLIQFFHYSIHILAKTNSTSDKKNDCYQCHITLSLQALTQTRPDQTRPNFFRARSIAWFALLWQFGLVAEEPEEENERRLQFWVLGFILL